MEDQLAKIVSKNLKEALKKVGMTAAELSRQSGVSMASLSRIISGQVNPSLSNMVRIAQVLNIGIDTLTGQEPEKTQQKKPLKKNQKLNLSESVLATYVLNYTEHSPSDAAKLLENAALGSWVDCWTERFVDSNAPKPRALESRAAGNKRIIVDMAFPNEWFEEGSIASLLSVTTAPITSTGAKLLDLRIPNSLLRTFNGPRFGMNGVRDVLNKYGRPLLSCTIRPMAGLSPKLYGRAIFEALRGGVDFTCDPTLLHSIPINRWRDRCRYANEAVKMAGSETDEMKMHIINATASTVDEMKKRAEAAKFSEYSDENIIMVDSAAIGWTALQSFANWCKENDFILCAMGGRALAGDVISEQLQAKLLRLAGCDIVSTGSPLRSGVANRRHVKGVVSCLREDTLSLSPEHGVLFDQPMLNTPASYPACGGGHNPWHFPRLLDALGDDIIIQCGGSIMGHPWGSAAGATANRTAVEALAKARGENMNLTVDGRVILRKAMQDCPELRVALDHWQEGSFLFGVVMGGEDRTGKKVEASVIDKNKQFQIVEDKEDE